MYILVLFGNLGNYSIRLRCLPSVQLVYEELVSLSGVAFGLSQIRRSNYLVAWLISLNRLLYEMGLTRLPCSERLLFYVVVGTGQSGANL